MLLLPHIPPTPTQVPAPPKPTLQQPPLLHMLLAQQGEPGLPQLAQMPLRQTFPGAQLLLPAQQACPGMPQTTQVLFAQVVPGCEH